MTIVRWCNTSINGNPDIAKAVAAGEEVTIAYRDFAESLILDPVDITEIFKAEC